MPADPAARVVEVRIAGTLVVVQLPEHEAVPQMPSGWLLFSPVEVLILRALLARGPLSREQIAHAVGEPLDGKLKFLLPNLVARRVLINTEAGLDLNTSTRDMVRSLLDSHGNSLPLSGS